MKIKAFTAICFLSMAASQVSAQAPTKISPNSKSDFRAADAEMETVWSKTYAGMKRRDEVDTSRGGGFGFAGATLESQRAWLTYRDRQCIIEGGQFAGESSQPDAQMECRSRLTRERTLQLRDLQWR